MQRWILQRVPGLVVDDRAGELPAGTLIKTLRARADAGTQVQTCKPLRKQPTHHHIVQPPAMTAAVVRRVDKECPDVAGEPVADGKGDDLAGVFDDPAAAGIFDRVDVQLFTDDR